MTTRYLERLRKELIHAHDKYLERKAKGSAPFLVDLWLTRADHFAYEYIQAQDRILGTKIWV
jgi:hypothetical protein